MIRGKAIKFGDNIDTDQIIGAHYLSLPTIAEMAGHAFEHAPQFVAHFSMGDIIVGGRNFGCGSSREQAPAVLKERGVGAVVACGFARIFFRNAINQGLLLIECPEAGQIRELEELSIEAGRLRSLATDRGFKVRPMPDFIRALIDEGGIIAHLRQSGRPASSV